VRDPASHRPGDDGPPGDADALSVAPEPFASPVASALLAAALAELVARYGPGPHDPAPTAAEEEADRLHRPLAAADFSAPGGIFLVGRRGGRPVGCVGLRPFEGSAAEVKRLWVDPGERGAGVARRLMAEVEAAAAALGYRRLVLETGGRQPEAIALYESSGWTRVPPYFGAPRHETSVYFDKVLEPPGPDA